VAGSGGKEGTEKVILSRHPLRNTSGNKQKLRGKNCLTSWEEGANELLTKYPGRRRRKRGERNGDLAKQR